MHRVMCTSGGLTLRQTDLRLNAMKSGKLVSSTCQKNRVSKDMRVVLVRISSPIRDEANKSIAFQSKI